MAYKSPYERKFGKKHPNNPAERKRKAEAAKPKPKPKRGPKRGPDGKAAPSKPKKLKESKDDKRNRSGLAITKLAGAAQESIKSWQKTADSEQSKTMDLKDRIRKERNKRIRER